MSNLESDIVEFAPISSPQRTLREPVRFSGVGLHTGIETEVVIEAAPIGYGIRFSHNAYCEPGQADFFYQSDHTTSVRSNGETFTCVEHLMSCLHVLNITNVHIRFLKGDEFPILDGSAAPIMLKMLGGGVLEQSEPALGIFIRRPVHVQDDKEGRAIWARPYQGLSVHAEIVFPPPIGEQSYSCEITEDAFNAEIADARTFLRDSVERVPLETVRLARLRGLAGPPVDLCQAIVYDDRSYLSKLRFEDEAVRHKILDFLGDIYTLGYPVRGEFGLVRPGHSFSLGFAKLVQQSLAAREKIARELAA